MDIILNFHMFLVQNRSWPLQTSHVCPFEPYPTWPCGWLLDLLPPAGYFRDDNLADVLSGLCNHIMSVSKTMT